jgi:high-affinity nickel-transport protein
LFLILVAGINLLLLRDIRRALRRAHVGGPLPEPPAGLLARLFRPLLAAVDAPWRMYPVGVLFGLGFDTATEIGLLAISAGAAMGGMAPWRTMVFPALFTAGMTLFDSADSILMAGAYRWAMADPLRKLWYNLTMTVASILVAVLVGAVETLGLIGVTWHLHGRLWTVVERANAHLGAFGVIVVAAFAASWGASALLYRQVVPRRQP